VCQRCLQTFSWPVSQQTLLLLARSESELAILDLDEEHEVVLAAAALDTMELIEDELLLSLPFAPFCARDECKMALPDANAADAALSPSAFAALAALKRGDVK